MSYVVLFVVVTYIGMWFAKRSHSRGVATIICFGMICISGLRHGYIDTRAYRYGFNNLDVAEVFSWNFWLNDETKDKGFSVLSAIIKIFTDNSQSFLFIMALVTVGCLFWGIIKRTNQIELGIFLFVTTGCFIDTMNGVRQALVSAILFYFLPQLIEEQKLIKYLIIVMLLSTVHASALLFIPLYFVSKKKAWSKDTYGLIIVCLIVYALFNSGMGQILVEILDGTSYGSDYSEMLLAGNTSVNVIRVFVVAAPIVLSLINRCSEKTDCTMYNIAFNMSVVNMLTWIFATKVLYFYRLAMYFQPYMILLVCYEIYYLRNGRNKKIITLVVYLCYFVFHIYSMYVIGDAIFVGYLKY